MADVQPYLIDRVEDGHRIPVLVWRFVDADAGHLLGSLGRRHRHAFVGPQRHRAHVVFPR